MITTVLFDLDGTLLPMDQEVFVKAYLGSMSKKMAPHGYDPETLIKAVWKGTGAMVQNDGTAQNETIFWDTFQSVMGRNCREDEALFDAYYQTDFQRVKEVCGFNAQAKQTIAEIRAMGLNTILATNPLFPPIATHSRLRWAGLEPEDFSLITTYDNSSFCKPNPDYYREILGKLNLRPEECLMVGNDAAEDMAAQAVGMRVFLLTDCLINRDGRDLSPYPRGGFPELMDYIRSL